MALKKVLLLFLIFGLILIVDSVEIVLTEYPYNKKKGKKIWIFKALGMTYDTPEGYKVIFKVINSDEQNMRVQIEICPTPSLIPGSD